MPILGRFTTVNHSIMARKRLFFTVRRLFHGCGGMAAIRWLRRENLSILMYHKFPEDTSALDRQCHYLRHHYHVISMSSVASALRSGSPLPDYSVAITVDDGHRSFYENAFPVFRKHQLPVIVNLTTGPIDAQSWLWFDRVSYAFINSPLQAVTLPSLRMGDGLEAPWRNTVEDVVLEGAERRPRLADEWMERMKSFPDSTMRQILSELESCLEVSLPSKPPGPYAVLDWEQVKIMARSGIDFGSHSVTHPILTRLTGLAQVEQEIRGSKGRIEAVLDRPVAHFAFPNGQPEDISDEVLRVVRDAGFITAVTTSGGQVQRGDNPYLLKRISCEPVMPDYQFRQHVAAFRVR
jgi:peptidoglycan/xylan/chitin deacetylase (PgdA/CDA1 family)